MAPINKELYIEKPIKRMYRTDKYLPCSHQPQNKLRQLSYHLQ